MTLLIQNRIQVPTPSTPTITSTTTTPVPTATVTAVPAAGEPAPTPGQQEPQAVAEEDVAVEDSDQEEAVVAGLEPGGTSAATGLAAAGTGSAAGPTRKDGTQRNSARGAKVIPGDPAAVRAANLAAKAKANAKALVDADRNAETVDGDPSVHD